MKKRISIGLFIFAVFIASLNVFSFLPTASFEKQATLLTAKLSTIDLKGKSEIEINDRFVYTTHHFRVQHKNYNFQESKLFTYSTQITNSFIEKLPEWVTQILTCPLYLLIRHLII